MVVRLAYWKVIPAKMKEASAIYYSDDISGIIRQRPGYRFHFLMESTEFPDEAISLTAWEDQEAAESYERSPVYKSLVEKFTEMFSGPERIKFYESWE